MAFSFHIRLPKGIDIQEKLQAARQAASQSKHDLKILGDAQAGTIEGVIRGSYRISEDAIRVMITRKPLLASKGLIQKTVAEFFS